MAITIAAERPTDPEVRELIGELEAILAPLYPDESRHGYAAERLVDRRVRFLVVRVDGEIAGCGGVELDGDSGELKRMYVRERWRGRGLARRLLAELERIAAEAGATVLRLETGVHQREAIGLYRSCGFHERGPFGSYRDDPLSLFFERSLDR
jgi:putative acetyltransferase